MAITALIGVIVGGLLFAYSFVGHATPALLGVGAVIIMGSFVWGLTGAKLPER